MQSLLVFALCLAAAYAHPGYRDFLPNGYAVPNPCGSGIWEAVGHYDPNHHTINKNRFGLAFSAAGHAWTRALCMADSDKDGKTNGEELGDPTCVWVKGDSPPVLRQDIQESVNRSVPAWMDSNAVAMDNSALENSCCKLL